tara:strand:+ start:575 stop:1177 length:603 start_codon:yes stop_codon:yes gene_type:complete
MGTTLSGLKIKDTYQGLIKLTDNAAASGSTKELTDGVGNDLNIQVDTTGRLEATSFVKTGGSSSQILLADGTVATSLSSGFLANDSVTYDKLGVEFSASQALSSGTTIAVDTALADVFTLTLGHSATLNFTNVNIGDVKTFVVTGGGGSYTITFGTINTASGTYNKLSGTYSDTGSAKNLIQIKFVSVTEAWYSISQIAS